MNFITPLLLFLTISLNAMQNLHVYAIPGQNGLGSNPEYVSEILNIDKTDITAVTTPTLGIDLGQSGCINHLKRVYNPQLYPNAIIHATSQGTATALNFVAQNQHHTIKAIILEATLATGNNAIMHTVTGPLMRLEGIAKLPFSYYWLPYVAKILFPFYNPNGMQAIKELPKIAKEIPIIIVHSKLDPQLSFTDACALYYGLKSQGNGNIYFVQKDGSDHIQLLKTGDIPVINTILQKHGLKPSSTVEEVDLTNFQPNHMQYKSHYDELIRKENNLKYINYSFKIGALGLLAYALYKKADTLKQLWPH